MTWLLTDHSSNNLMRFDDAGVYQGDLIAPGAGGLREARGFTRAPDGALLIVSAYERTSSVLQFDWQTGAFQRVLATGNGLDHPYSIAFGPPGSALAKTFFVTNQDNHLVSAFAYPSGAHEGHFVPAGGGLRAPRLGHFGPDGDYYVASRDTHSILRFHNGSGAALGPFVEPGSGGLHTPIQFTWGPDGHLYVGSAGNDRILLYDGTSGAPLGVFVDGTHHAGGKLSAPSGISWGSDGDLYVASRQSGKVLRYDGTTGAYLGVLIGNRGLKRDGSVIPLEHPEFIAERTDPPVYT